MNDELHIAASAAAESAYAAAVDADPDADQPRTVMTYFGPSTDCPAEMAARVAFARVRVEAPVQNRRDRGGW